VSLYKNDKLVHIEPLLANISRLKGIYINLKLKPHSPSKGPKKKSSGASVTSLREVVNLSCQP